MSVSMGGAKALVAEIVSGGGVVASARGSMDALMRVVDWDIVVRMIVTSETEYITPRQVATLL